MQQPWLPHHQPSTEQGSQQLIPGLTAWTHTQLQQDSPGTGWGGEEQEPQAPGSPSGVSLNPRSSSGSCSQHPPPPNPKALLRGMCHSSNLSEHRSLHPSSHSPSSRSLSPPLQQHLGPPSPSQAQHPREHRMLVGCAGAVRQQPAGQGPLPAQTSSGAGCLPHTPGCDTSPYPPLPRALICPQDEPGLLGAGDHPSCWLLEEHREASGGNSL